MRNLLHDVEADWVRDADGFDARAALARWRHKHPELGAFTSPGDLVRRCHSRTDPDSVRAADTLMDEARDDPWAARTILAVLLPGLGRLIRARRDLIGDNREPFASVEELDQFVLSTAYERIAEGPSPSRTCQLQAVLDTTAGRLRNHATAHHRDFSRRGELSDNIPDPLGGGRTTAEELAAALVDAVERGVLRAGDARLVYATRVAGHSTAELADAMSWQRPSLRRRRQRVERLLAAEVQGDDRPTGRPVAARAGA